MSQFMSGTLTIITRNGRYGKFNIGKLTTSIGEFVVKDKELDQYDAGKYQGQFEIDNIKSTHYNYGNCLVVECRAYLASMSLYDITNLTNEELEINTREQDPLEEEIPIIPQTVQQNPTTMNQTSYSDSHVVIEHNNPDAMLFGLLWPLGSTVKLDLTCDRDTLRKQKDRLDQLGYVFSYKTQEWHLQ